MKTLGRVVLGLVVLVAVLAGVAYAGGAMQPVDHVTSVEGVVNAPPAAVFARIVDVADGPKWRPDVKRVKLLPPDAGRDHWVEDLDNGALMDFTATRTDAPAGVREVLLHEPSGQYGGTWVYQVSPDGPGSRLKITEAGFIKPPIYRFMMARVFGMRHNLDAYLKNMKRAAGA